MNGGNVGGDTGDIVVTNAVLGTNILDYGSIPSPVYTGYTLQGWAYDDAGTSMVGATDNVTADDTIYAIWDIVTYNVTYELDGGTNNVGNPDTFDVTDLPVTLLDATKDGSTFDGWFTDAGLTVEVTTISAVGDITLYAKWV